MKILLTSTSFIDTPGKHQERLYNEGLEVDTLRGPVKEDDLLPIISKYDGIVCGDDEITRQVIKEGVEGKLKVISKYGIGLDIDLGNFQTPPSFTYIPADIKLYTKHHHQHRH